MLETTDIAKNYNTLSLHCAPHCVLVVNASST